MSHGPPNEFLETADEVGQAKQIVELLKENKAMTALVLFVLWQTGMLLEFYSNVQGGLC